MLIAGQPSTLAPTDPCTQSGRHVARRKGQVPLPGPSRERKGYLTPFLMMGDVPYWPDSTAGGGGVSMTASTTCNAAYAAYVDETGQNIWAASYNGAGWTLSSDPIFTIPNIADYALPTPTFQTNPPSPGYFITSAPALFGENTTPPYGYSPPASPIGYAYTRIFSFDEQLAQKGSSYYTYTYGVTQGQFNCNFSTNSGVPEQGDNSCLFWDPNTGYCDNLYEFDEGFKTSYLSGPQSPLWTGAVGPNGEMVELRAQATGNALGNDNPPIWYAFGSPNWFSTYGDTEGCLGTNCAVAPPNGAGQWTNNGLGGAINPADGTPWFVYTCRYFDPDTCQGPGHQYFNLYHMTSEGTPGNGQLCIANGEAYGNSNSAYSNSAPAMTFWNGQLWMAYQAGNGGNEQVTVVSIDPSNIGFNGGPPGPSTASVSPTSLTFTSRFDAPVIETATLTNYGPGMLLINSIQVSGDSSFSLSGGSCTPNQYVTPGNACSAQVTFAPQGCVSGAAGQLSIYDSSTTGLQTVSLSGSTKGCQQVLTP